MNGHAVRAIIDTGATTSVVSSAFVSEKDLKRGNAIPIQVASGMKLFSLGTATISLRLGNEEVKHEALVLETGAFEAVLGLDFIGAKPCGGILTCPRPCRLLFRNKEIPLNEGNEKVGFHKVQRLFKKESYFLAKET